MIETKSPAGATPAPQPTPALLRRRWAIVLLAAGSAWAIKGSQAGETPAHRTAVFQAPGTQPELPPDAVKIGEDLYRVGKVTVDLKAGTATSSGKINMRRGIVEYLAVAPGGKTHESLLTVDVRPLHLQVALILLGLEPKGGLTVQGDEKPPKGSPVQLYVSWKRGNRTVKVRGEELVWNIDRKQPMEAGAWIFSGSLVDKRGFLADEELSLVATFRDPAAIVNNALPAGSDDTVYKVNERIVPPIGTPVTFIATSRADAKPATPPKPERSAANR